MYKQEELTELQKQILLMKVTIEQQIAIIKNTPEESKPNLKFARECHIQNIEVYKGVLTSLRAYAFILSEKEVGND